MQSSDQVKVVGFEGVENLCGVQANIKAWRSPYNFPLCDLKVADKKSANYALTDDYAVWFANR